ncbi:MAG TPA: alpha/beta fold hydrolase [Solirubrobacterales bacterium]|jgi:pimeloyl-ACP methyl ester carboxylesterase
MAATTQIAEGSRERLLDGIPVTERRLELAGLSTLVLGGGEGPPVVLLHGPGESAVKWMSILPALTRTNTVLAPDLPAHGETEVPDWPLEPEPVLNWLEALVDDQCSAPPTIVGQVLGGALGARFAATRSNRLSGLVLVDSLGLGRFRPSPRFALTMAGFLARPSERSYNRFMRQCSFDLDGLRDQMGERWDAFVDYNIDLARSPKAKAAGRLMRKVGLPRIPAAELERIAVPTTLIWGRQDRAIRLRIAEAASARFGWRLRVIEDCADDPPRDRPAEFLSALRPALPS